MTPLRLSFLTVEVMEVEIDITANIFESYTMANIIRLIKKIMR